MVKTEIPERVGLVFKRQDHFLDKTSVEVSDEMLRYLLMDPGSAQKQYANSKRDREILRKMIGDIQNRCMCSKAGKVLTALTRQPCLLVSLALRWEGGHLVRSGQNIETIELIWGRPQLQGYYVFHWSQF